MQASINKTGKQWNIKVLKPGESKTFTQKTSLSSTGNVEQCYLVDYTPGWCITTEVVKPELSITRAVVDENGNEINEAYLCDEAYIEYTVTNEGSGRTGSVTLSEDLADWVSHNGESSVEMDLGRLRSGQEVTRTIPVSFDRPGNFNSYAIAETGNLRARSDSQSVDVMEPQLSLTVQGPGKEYVKRDLSYSLRLTNDSQWPALNTVVRLHQPNATTRLTSNSQNFNSSRNMINVGTLEPGETKNYNVTFEGSTPQEIVFRAEATAYCAAAVEDQVATNLAGIPAVLVSIIDRVDPVPVGEETNYRIHVKNQGSAKDLNINLRANMPDNLEVLSVSGPGNARVEGNNIRFARIDALNPGEMIEFNVRAKATSAGKITTDTFLTSDANQEPVETSEPTTIY